MHYIHLCIIWLLSPVIFLANLSLLFGRKLVTNVEHATQFFRRLALYIERERESKVNVILLADTGFEVIMMHITI